MAPVLKRMPFSTEMPTLLAASDVVVFPSITPHFARPVIEGAAMGVPAVGSDLPGVRELIDDGRTGILVKAGSAKALADALLTILRDDRLARELGEGARQMAYERFEAQTRMREVMGVYERVLA